MLAPPTEEEWKRLTSGPLRWLTVSTPSGTPALIAAYRAYYIATPPGGGGLIQGAQLVYCEACGSGSPLRAVQTIFTQIARKHTVCHGISMGPLVALAADLRLVQTTERYLDFYNLALEPVPTAQEVSLLYM